MDRATDADLYGRACAGDRGAVEALVARHHPDLVRYARAKGGGSHRAEDAAQMAWIKFFKHLRQADGDEARRLRQPDRVKFWLLTATHNALRDMFRAEQRDDRLASRFAAEERAQTGQTYQPDLMERLTTEERRRMLQQAFQRLSEICRQLLSLLMVDPPLPYREVAELLDRPVGSIGPTRQRCIDQLRLAM